jgi:alpha-L-rhamnosidase
VITYEDGSETVITTNDRDWKYFNKGPVVYGSFFQGELYDAAREASIKGWDVADFNDQSWTDAVEIPLKGSSFEGTVGSRADGTVSFNFDKMSLIGQIGENAAMVKELTAVKVEEVRPGIFVYDMGQNMVGVPLIRLDGEKAGTRITLRYAEMKYPDLSEYEQNTGMIMIENIRAAPVSPCHGRFINSMVILHCWKSIIMQWLHISAILRQRWIKIADSAQIRSWETGSVLRIV